MREGISGGECHSLVKGRMDDGSNNTDVVLGGQASKVFHQERRRVREDLPLLVHQPLQEVFWKDDDVRFCRGCFELPVSRIEQVGLES